VKTDVLFMLAEGRADMVRKGIVPPYVAHLLPKRAAKLRAELLHLGAVFGVPFARVPDHREDDEKWFYMGIVLEDIHVYERDGCPSPRAC
jgi:hypothetical protein